MGAFLSRDNQGQSHGNVVETCDASTGAAAVQMPASLSHETSSGADEEGENFDSFTPVKAKRKCRAPPGLRAPPKPSPPPTPATPPEKRKLSKQEIRDAGNAQLLKVLREDLARAEARLQLVPHLVLERREKRKAEHLKFRERDWPSSLEVKFDNAEPSFPPSCPSSCIESARQILVLHAVCDRLESVEPCRRPRSLKSFENFTRKARSIKTYTLDWQAVAASLGVSVKVFQLVRQECKETPTELQLALIRRRFEIAKDLPPSQLPAWIQAQTYVAKSYSAEQVLAKMRTAGILTGPEDFGASMVLHPDALLPEKRWLPTTLSEAFAGSPTKIVSLVTFELQLPTKGVVLRRGFSEVGHLLGHRGSRIKAELEALKRKLAAAKVPVSKVLCSLRQEVGGSKQRMQSGLHTHVTLKVYLPIGFEPVCQSFEVVKDFVIRTLRRWFKEIADRCDYWDQYTLARVRESHYSKIAENQPKLAQEAEVAVSKKSLASERWEQQVQGRLLQVRHRQEQDDKILRRVQKAQRNRRAGRGRRHMLAPAQVTRFERRRRMVEVDDEPSAWDFTCK
mmetsp:Transcript_78597/g.172290  ORF Transcript_78597/g.172290 Transcript_78597/m.172290 type:complete len:566 (+) Transcript_78597:102-1799(+)